MRVIVYADKRGDPPARRLARAIDGAGHCSPVYAHGAGAFMAALRRWPSDEILVIFLAIAPDDMLFLASISKWLRDMKLILIFKDRRCAAQAGRLGLYPRYQTSLEEDLDLLAPVIGGYIHLHDKYPN